MPPSAKGPFRRGSLLAAGAALLFGLTTPLIRRAGQGAGAVSIAATLYAGAALASLGRGAAASEARIRSRDLPRLFAIGVAGALVAPACLAWGLSRTSAAGASLLLNFEALFTALLGFFLFHEHLGRRALVALVSMVLGGVLLVEHASLGGFGWGAVAVVGATLAWSVDNALTRPLSDLNPTEVVRYKSVIGAVLGVILALALGESFPKPGSGLALLFIGATGYGISLRLYLLAQREIGVARTASIFASAPFLGALVAVSIGDQLADAFMLVPAALFAVGVYLHLTEAHGHVHAHDADEHEHAHRHDDGHHFHPHQPPVEGVHSHPHRHESVTHEHPHAPDLHHQHRH